MKKINIVCLTLVSLLLTTTLFAQAPEAQLSKADVSLFIKSFKPLQKDLEALGDKYEKMNTENMSMASATAASWMVNDDVKAVFEKHGWNEEFMQKYVTIVSSVAYLKMEQELAKMPAEQQQYAQQMLSTYKMQVAQSIHENDLNVVRERLGELEAIFEEDN